jgi:drug/metabolite transporter (DMT)-like permease
MTVATRQADAVLFVLLAMLWGSSYLVIRLAGTELDPLSLVALPLVVGTIALGVAVGVVRPGLPPRGAWRHLVVVGALGIAIPFSLITWSERSVDSGLASIIIGATPLLSALMVARSSIGEGVGIGRLLGLGLGFLGVVLVASGGIRDGGDPHALAGLGLAAVSYAANAAYTRRHLGGVAPVTAAFGQAVAALIIVGGLALVLDAPVPVVPSPAVLGAALWLGVLPSALAPLIYFRLITRWGVTRTMMVNFLSPVVGVGAGVMVAGEVPGSMVLAGGAAVILGLGLANAGSSLAAMRRSVVRPVTTAAGA